MSIFEMYNVRDKNDMKFRNDTDADPLTEGLDSIMEMISYMMLESSRNGRVRQTFIDFENPNVFSPFTPPPIVHNIVDGIIKTDFKYTVTFNTNLGPDLTQQQVNDGYIRITKIDWTV